MDTETRIVFMGTPQFAVPSLQALAKRYAATLKGVVTQPDRPAGRGRQPHQSAVKRAALGLGLDVFQPEKIGNPEAIARLDLWQPTVIVVVAFGQILPASVLEFPQHGCLNVHASLLPRWRGAAPIQYAIWAGDAETGITIMQMDEGLDTGPILSQRGIPLSPNETAASLHDRLSLSGADLLLETLPGYLSVEIEPSPQSKEGVTYAPSLKKEAGHIDWTQTAIEIDRQVRALNPWPGTFTQWGDRRLKILSGEADRYTHYANALAGTIVASNNSVSVVAGEGLFRLLELQGEGRKPTTAQAFLNGHPTFVGAQLD